MTNYKINKETKYKQKSGRPVYSWYVTLDGERVRLVVGFRNEGAWPTKRDALEAVQKLEELAR